LILICINYVALGARTIEDTTNVVYVRMSIDRISQLNRFLGLVLIALYFALALTFVPDLLPSSSIAILLTGSGQRWPRSPPVDAYKGNWGSP